MRRGGDDDSEASRGGDDVAQHKPDGCERCCLQDGWQGRRHFWADVPGRSGGALPRQRDPPRALVSTSAPVCEKVAEPRQHAGKQSGGGRGKRVCRGAAAGSWFERAREVERLRPRTPHDPPVHPLTRPLLIVLVRVLQLRRYYSCYAKRFALVEGRAHQAMRARRETRRDNIDPTATGRIEVSGSLEASRDEQNVDERALLRRRNSIEADERARTGGMGGETVDVLGERCLPRPVPVEHLLL